MLKDITFGQYYEGRSVIHKTDPRVKIILMILFIVFVFLAKNTFALIFAGVSVLAVMLISRVPLPPMTRMFLFRAYLGFFGRLDMVSFSVWVRGMFQSGIGST